MAQQINLFHRALREPRVPLAPRAMLQILGGWVTVLAVVGLALGWRTYQLQKADDALSAQRQAQRQQLEQAQVMHAQLQDPQALRQQVEAVERDIAHRRTRLSELGADLASGHPNDLLQELARTLPRPVWVTRLHWVPDSVLYEGYTQEPDALQRWIVAQGVVSDLSLLRDEAAPERWRFKFSRRHSATGSTP